MREIKARLTREIEDHCKDEPPWKAPAFPVKTFRSLVEQVARLAYANPEELLFFRGQDRDYQSKAGGTSVYPAIYRGDPLAARELRHRFDVLDEAARMLVERFKAARIDGHYELRRKKYIQWSILQHYEVAHTPLLDLTQSLRVACSFAQLRAGDPTCFIYVFGMPFISNRISINSEHDIVNIRLLSICPPSALRPYFQEGFLAGTADVTTEFDSKTELDFRNRMVAKFVIPRAKSFWGKGFAQIPESALYPKSDQILELCSHLKVELREELQPGDLGHFVKTWADIEDMLVSSVRALAARNTSARETIRSLASSGRISDEQAATLEALRKFRNVVVHEPRKVDPRLVGEWTGVAQTLELQLRKALPQISP